MVGVLSSNYKFQILSFNLQHLFYTNQFTISVVTFYVTSFYENRNMNKYRSYHESDPRLKMIDDKPMPTA